MTNRIAAFWVSSNRNTSSCQMNVTCQILASSQDTFIEVTLATPEPTTLHLRLRVRRDLSSCWYRIGVSERASRCLSCRRTYDPLLHVHLYSFWRLSQIKLFTFWDNFYGVDINLTGDKTQRFYWA